MDYVGVFGLAVCFLLFCFGVGAAKERCEQQQKNNGLQSLHCSVLVVFTQLWDL